MEMISEGLENSIEVTRIWTIEEIGEEEDEMGPGFLNFHGTLICNVASIIRHGFQINKNSSGLFGEGVYTTPVLNFAKHYCHMSDEMPRGIVIGAKVIMGRTLYTNRKKLKSIPDIFDTVTTIAQMEHTSFKKIVNITFSTNLQATHHNTINLNSENCSKSTSNVKPKFLVEIKKIFY